MSEAAAKVSRKGGASTSAMLLCGAVSVLALPSAVLAYAGGFAPKFEMLAANSAEGAFVPSEVDPRLSRSITVRALSKGKLFRFTPGPRPTGQTIRS